MDRLLKRIRAFWGPRQHRQRVRVAGTYVLLTGPQAKRYEKLRQQQRRHR